jgi:hypothetical protein
MAVRNYEGPKHHGETPRQQAFEAQPLADVKIIHIAAHGTASAKFPDRAALVLGSDPKADEDGLLQVRQIRDLSLSAGAEGRVRASEPRALPWLRCCSPNGAAVRSAGAPALYQRACDSR